MTDDRLLHVLGGGPWQVPTVTRAKQLGYRVLVTDVHAERPAYAIADHHEVVDITNLDATLRVARAYGVGGIVCDTTDVGVPTAAYVADQLGLPGIGFATALNCTNKGRLRHLAAAAGVAVPRYRLVAPGEVLRDMDGAWAYPIVVKPVDNQSGRGVSLVDRPDQLGTAVATARGFTREGTVLIEECLRGTEVIVDGFVAGGAVHVLGLSQKVPDPDAPTVAVRITYSAQFPRAVAEAIVDTNRRTLAALGLSFGVFHAEYFVDDFHVVPIDVAARGGGAHIYTHVIPNVSGVDVGRCTIDAAMGQRVSVSPRVPPMAANLEFLRLPAGTLQRVDGLDEALSSPGVVVVHLNVAPGSPVGTPMNKDDRPGHIVTIGATADEAVARGTFARGRLRVLMTGDTEPIPLSGPIEGRS